MRKYAGMGVIFFLASILTLAQDHFVNGHLSDEAGRPISGATIQVKGGGRSVVSDVHGNFSLPAGDNDRLVISFVGYQTLEIRAGDAGHRALVLSSSARALDSVLVTTALGIRRSRSSLPYATQQLSGEELNRTPGTNFINNLSGKIAGLQITSSNALGGSANVILRGLKSLTQSNQALFIVDGVPYDNTSQNLGGYDLGNPAGDLNPDDISSVNVLKGAAASALYGSRAANGVIIISTRRTRSRVKAVNISVRQTAQTGLLDRSTLPKYQTQYGQGYGSAGANSPDGFFYYQPAVGSGGQPVNIVQTDEDQVWGSAYDPSLKVYNWNAFSPGNPNYGKATAWTAAQHHDPSDFLVTPITSITGIYVNASGTDATLKAGYSNSYDKGILPNSNIKKNSLYLDISYDLSTRLTIGGLINYSEEKGINRNSYDFRAINTSMRDFRQWWPTNVDLEEQKADYFRSRTNNTWNWSGGYATAAPGNLPKAAYHNNAYWTQYENYNNDSRVRYFGNINLNYKITDGLNLFGRIARDAYDQLFETRIAVGSYQTPGYSIYQGSFSETNYDLLLNYDKRVTGNWSIKALLGGNIRQVDNGYTSAATAGGLVVPHFYTLSNSVKTPATPIQYNGRKEVDGVFAGLTLGYRSFLTLDATLRRDQSSTLPKSNNAYYYPAVSGAFLFSRLLPDLTWLSYGKLRVNYAEVGGDAPIYSTRNTYVAGTPFNGQTLFSYTTTNNNPDLRPERNRTYEAGVELSFLRNRMGLDLTYYHSRLSDQIMPITPSTASGFSLFYVNGGTIQNQGVELTLHAAPVRTKDFSWEIILNWARNNNKVISLYAGQPSYTVAAYQNGIQLVAETGKSFGILRGSDYQYFNGQRLIDANGYPVKAVNTKSDIGNINPDWLGGVTNTLTYGNFSFSFLVDVKKGGDVYSLDMDYASWSGVIPETAGNNDLGKPLRNPLSQGGGIVLKGVTKDGKPNAKRVDAYDINIDGGNFPFGSVNSLAASSYVYDAGYVKLRELSVGWSLPGDLFGKNALIRGIDVSLSGRNLWIIHKNLPYADPEQGAASTTPNSTTPIVYNPNASIGYQTGVYPNVRTVAFSLKLKF
ncbi:MAG: SusC/RagA family TonB-linked outer membrane protein [Chitinophagaceae bacterium]|nr:SusC/RagA family TonB-linked outer membrane protein [Chitinophagaceae bacterium]